MQSIGVSFNSNMLDNLCRFCGQEQDRSLIIDIYDAANSHVLQMASVFVPGTISQDDPYPKWVCENCVTMLSTINDFHVMNLRVLQVFKDMLSIWTNEHSVIEVLEYKCRFCAQHVERLWTSCIYNAENAHLYEVASLYASEWVSTDRYPKYACNSCITVINARKNFHNLVLEALKMFAYMLSLKDSTTLETDQNLQHMQTHTDDKLFKCNECGKCFSQKTSLATHIKRKKHYRREECNEYFYLKPEFIRHMDSHKANYHCIDCDDRFVAEKSLLDKVTTYHPLKFSLQDSTTLETDQNLQHMQTHTDDKVFKCNECGKSFSRKASLAVHIKLKKHYRCKECKQYFPLKSEFIRHMDGHKANDHCIDCDEPFVAEKNLLDKVTTYHPLKFSLQDSTTLETDQNLQHMQTHTDDKVFKCNECGKSFSRKASLATHVKRKKHYRCKECKQYFPLKSEFIRHMDGHKANDHCIDCDEPFVPEKNLLDKVTTHHPHKLSLQDSTPLQNDQNPLHMQTQTDDTHFKCDMCGQRFTRKNSLALHIKLKIHYRCEDCNEYFNRKAEFIRHTMIHKANYHCIQCDECFDAGRKLEAHDNTHHNREEPLHCEICLKPVLRKWFLRNNTKLYRRVKLYECNKCKKDFNQEAHLIIHMRSHTGQRPFICVVCKKGYSSSGSLKTHQWSHFGDKRFKCKHCGKCFTKKADLVIHIRAHTGERPFQCKLCEKSFTSKPVLITHLLYHSSVKPYECNECAKCYRRKGELVNHIATHSGERPFLCNVCEKRFPTKRALKLHQLSHSAANRLKCNHCGKCFADKSKLVIHIRAHTGERPFQCQVCKNSFKSKTELESHQICHSDVKPYECDGCTKCFSRKQQLVRHINTHTGPLPFLCKVCEKRFRTSCALKLHQTSHPVVKRFKCNDCGKCFVKKCRLVIHIRAHTGERPFQCQVCKTSFKSKDGLKGHQISHVGVKPYECNECAKCFRRKGELVNHIRTHIRPRPFLCKFCPKRFRTASTLKLHESYRCVNRASYSCPYCQNKFWLKSDLVAHVRTHTGKQTLTCEVCKKSFCSKRNLKTHQTKRCVKPVS